MKHSELAAKLAIEGTVGAIAGTVYGQLPIRPKVLNQDQRAELGASADGEFLFYPLGDSGVFFHTLDAITTIWFADADCRDAIAVLDAAVRRHYPNAKIAQDGPHKNLPGWGLRAYDIKVGNGKLALVEAGYPIGRVEAPKFTIRVVALAVRN